MEYLNYLGSSGNKINSISKEMKSNFFSTMVNKSSNEYDELKYLILMREEFFKYKLKLYYYYKWRSHALYNRDLIDDENPFVNNKSNYENFKKHNYISKNSINMNILNNDNNKFKDNYDKRISNINNANEHINNNNNINLLNLDEDPKIIDNQNMNNPRNMNQQLNNLNILLNNEEFLNIKSAQEKNPMNNRLNSNNLENINNNKDKNELIDLNDLLAKSSKNSINYNKKESIYLNDLIALSNKNSINNNIKESINVLNIQKNINDALNKTNNLFISLNSQLSGNIGKKENFNNIIHKTENNNEIKASNNNNNINNNKTEENDFDNSNDVNNANNINDIIKKYKNLKINTNINEKNKNQNNKHHFEKNKTNNINNINNDNLNYNLNNINDQNNNNYNISQIINNNKPNNIYLNEKEYNEKNSKYLKDIFKLKANKSFNNTNKMKNKSTLNKNINQNDTNIYNNINQKYSFLKVNKNKPINKLSKYYKINKEVINKNNSKKNKSLKDINSFKNNSNSNTITYNKDSTFKKSNNNNQTLESNDFKPFKKFDIKTLYRYPVKTINLDEQVKEKYKNSKYLSMKYPNYLNTEENLSISKSKGKKKKILRIKKSPNNNLYNNSVFSEKDKDIQIALTIDNNNSINPLKSDHIPKIPIIKNTKLKTRDLSADRIREKENIDNVKSSYYTNSNDNFTDSLLKNGFFASRKPKKFDYSDLNLNIRDSNYYNDIEAEKRYEIYNMKVKKLLEKYNQIKDKDINFDYVKKCKGTNAEIYGISTSQNNVNLYNKNNRSNKNTTTDDYESILISKDKSKIYKTKNYIKSSSNYYRSDNSMSIKNILTNLGDNKKDKYLISYNNYYGYDDLINNINENQTISNNNRTIRYSKDSRRTANKSISNRDKREFFSTLNIDESRGKTQNKSYVLAPMHGVPVTKISFRARLKYYSNKREKELKKLINKKVEEEKQIYTFHPKTDDNRLNVIKYSTNSNSNSLANFNITQNTSNSKRRKVDSQRINDLYMDYRDKQNKIDRLAKEYYKKAGISFSPHIRDNNKEIKMFKKKIGQMPYLDRIEVYNHNRDFNRTKRNDINNVFYSTEI